MLLHHDKKVIAPPSKSRPRANDVVEAMQRLCEPSVPYRESFEVRRRRAETERTQRNPPETGGGEQRFEFRRVVVLRPHRLPVQRYAHRVGGKADTRAIPVAARGIQREFPGADPADDRGDEDPTGPQTLRNLASGGGK